MKKQYFFLYFRIAARRRGRGEAAILAWVLPYPAFSARAEKPKEYSLRGIEFTRQGASWLGTGIRRTGNLSAPGLANLVMQRPYMRLC
jgi:hypothetical protein